MKEEKKIKEIGKTVIAFGAESLNEIKNQGVKTIKEITDFAKKAYENFKDNQDFKKALIAATDEFEIVGATNILSQPLKLRAFVISKHELLFKCDDKEINRILSGTLLKNKSKNDVIFKITNIDTDKQINYQMVVNEEECIIPCIRAKYKITK